MVTPPQHADVLDALDAPTGPRGPRRRGIAAVAFVAVASAVAGAAVLARPHTDREQERTLVPAARPSMDRPIDGAPAPAVREARPAGPGGVGSGPLAPGPNGAAAPAGVRVAPGASVQAAIDAAGPGGTVVIGAGEHRGQYELRPRDNQTIVGEPGAVLNGSRVVAGFAASGPRWVAGGQPTAQPSTNAPCQPGAVLCGAPDDLFYDSTPLRRVGSAAEVTAGTWFHDYGAGQIWIGNDPNGHLVEQSVPGQHALKADLGRGGQAVTVRNLTIEKYGTPAQECAVMAQDAGGGWQRVTDPANGSSGGWRVEFNTFRLNHGCGVFAGPGTVVTDNRMNDNGQLGVKGGGRRITVVRNEIARNNFAGHSRYWEAGGAKFFGTIALTFAYNDVHDNLAVGAWADYALTETVIDHNTFRNNVEGGVWAEMTLSGAITFNDMSGNDSANVGDAGKTHGAIFLYNASNFDVSGNRLVGNNGGVVAQAQIRGCIGANITQGQGACPAGSTPGSNAGTYVHDNEISMTTGFTGLIVLPYADFAPYAQSSPSWAQQQLSAIRFDYNVYDGTGYASNRGSNGNQFDVATNRFLWGFPSGFSTNPSVIWTWVDKRYVGFADWQGIAGQDRNGALRGS